MTFYRKDEFKKTCLIVLVTVGHRNQFFPKGLKRVFEIYIHNFNLHQARLHFIVPTLEEVRL